MRKIDQASVPLPDQNGAWTGNAGNAEFFPNNGRLSFVSKGLDVHRQQLADGTGMMHRAGDGKTILFSNMSPNQYTAADGTPNARWEQTQAYIDAQNRLQADKLRIAEMQAIRQGMNPVQAAAATQGMAQAAQRAPLDRQVVQQQIDTGKVAAQNAKELQDLYAAHKASTDPAEQERIAATIRARTGKDKAQNYKAAVLAGAKTLEGSEAERGYLINEQTGEVRPLESFGSAPAAQQTKGLPAPKSISERDRLPSGTKYVAPDGQVRICLLYTSPSPRD